MDPLAARVTTLTHAIEQSVHHVNQMASGGSFVAIFTLRMTPNPSEPSVKFASTVDDPDLEPWMLQAIERGVFEFAAERARDDQPIGAIDVVLTSIRIHPVDSKDFAFVKAAKKAMVEAFSKHATQR